MPAVHPAQVRPRLDVADPMPVRSGRGARAGLGSDEQAWARFVSAARGAADELRAMGQLADAAQLDDDLAAIEAKLRLR